ncbi:MAG TPA: MBL fold metallo-hydrolase [Vicinamibacteria bacterium]|nr:MBL fold metallo-hydrolase [Vicinamibacteria bacterium]
MARIARRLPENAPGDFYVDDTCIDCATCRVVAPQVFAPVRGLSYVHHQPADAAGRRRALMALVACPTASIGTASRAPAAEGVAAFPEPLADGVHYCGFAAEASFGASSYLVVRTGGNVLVDSPRAAAPLKRRVAELGGLRLMVLTHRDDVADHARWRARFACERVLHEGDLGGQTRGVERVLSGLDPVPLAPDLVLVPVPGHTRGSIALLYADTFLFSGDHLMAAEDGSRLVASRSVCWYSWPEQVRSLERLLDYRFEWVLPGHGGRFRARSAAAMRAELERLLARLR